MACSVRSTSRRDDDEEEAAAPVAIEGVRNHPTGHGVDVRWQSALLQRLPNFFIRITPLSSLASCPRCYRQYSHLSMQAADSEGDDIEDVGIVDILARELYESTACSVRSACEIARELYESTKHGFRSNKCL